MIYIQHGLTNSKLNAISSDLSDFDWLWKYEPQLFLKATNEELSNDSNNDIKHNFADYVWAGNFTKLTRNDSNLEYRTVLFIDLDNTKRSYKNVIDILNKSDLKKIAYIAYPTIKNGLTDNARLRIAINLSRNIIKSEWQPLTEMIGKMIGLEVDKNANNKWSQAHGLPLLTSHNTSNMIVKHDGIKLPVDKVLERYTLPKAQKSSPLTFNVSNGNKWHTQNSLHLQELLTGIDEGGRNNGLFVFVKHFLFVTGGNTNLVYELATTMNNNSTVPLQEAEFNKTFLSAYKNYKGGI